MSDRCSRTARSPAIQAMVVPSIKDMTIRRPDLKLQKSGAGRWYLELARGLFLDGKFASPKSWRHLPRRHGGRLAGKA